MMKKMFYRLGVSIIAVTLSTTSAFATKIRSVNMPTIVGDEDLNDLSAKIIRVESIANDLRKGEDPKKFPPVVESFSLGRATKSALDEAKWMESEVLNSPALVLPIDFYNHKKIKFSKKMRDSYPEFKDEEYVQYLSAGLSKLFDNLQNHLGKQQTSNNWKKTKVEKVMVSFGRNTKGDYLDPLKIGLPVYKDQRLAEKAAFTPRNMKLTKSQEDSLCFLVHVLVNKPEQLMNMVSYRSYHPEEPLADSQYFFTHGKSKALELPKVVQIDNYAEKRKVFDKKYIEGSLLPILQLMTSHPAYKAYQDFISSSGTGYHHGMYMYDYWQLWVDSKFKEATQKYTLPRYELPLDLIKDKSMYDRQFVELVLLPTIRNFCTYEPYKCYKSFITVDGTGYKPGKDMPAYWQSWLNSRWGETAKKYQPLKTYKPNHTK